MAWGMLRFYGICAMNFRKIEMKNRLISTSALFFIAYAIGEKTERLCSPSLAAENFSPQKPQEERNKKAWPLISTIENLLYQTPQKESKKKLAPHIHLTALILNFHSNARRIFETTKVKMK